MLRCFWRSRLSARGYACVDCGGQGSDPRSQQTRVAGAWPYRWRWGLKCLALSYCKTFIGLSLSEKRLTMIGPCKTNCDLRRKERFNKGARAIIHRYCLLPVLSGGGLNCLVTSFESFGVCRFTAATILCTRRERFRRRTPPLI